MTDPISIIIGIRRGAKLVVGVGNKNRFPI